MAHDNGIRISGEIKKDVNVRKLARALLERVRKAHSHSRTAASLSIAK